MCNFIIGVEVTDVSNKPVAFILKLESRTRRFQELVHLPLRMTAISKRLYGA